MSEIKINVDLDLDTKKAKDQLDSFKKSTSNEKIPVRLDIDKAKQDANSLKNVLSDAFKLDSNTIGNLKQVESALKQINKLIKSQSELSKKNNTNNKDGIFTPFTIKKNVDIVKDVSNLVDDYEGAKKQLEDLDKIGKGMKEVLDDFNKNQESAFKTFLKDSKSYDAYLKELEGDNISSTLKKAINARKKSIELQEELTKSGVVKVDNTQLRNERYDGSIFTIENEKWKAMFAKTESEAKDLEDMARKIKPKIDSANNTVSELMTQLSKGEREILEAVSKAYEQRPQFSNLSGFDNDNISVLRMYLENVMPDVDKIGLNFDDFDDIFRGLDRFYSRLEQMQNEYNHKFAGQDDFKPMRLDSLLDIEQDEAKRIIKEAENNNDLLEKAINDRISILNRSNSGEGGLNFGINESSLEDMEKFITLSRIVNKTMSDTGNGNKTSNEVKEYLKVSKQLSDLYADLYKSETNGTTDVSSEIREKIELLRKMQLENASAIRSNSELYASMREKIDAEEKLYQATQNIKNARTDEADRVKALKEEDKELKSLISTYDKYEKELTDLKQTQNNFINDGKENSADSLKPRIEELQKLKKELKETNEIKFGDKLVTELDKVEKKYKDVATASERLSKAKQSDSNTATLNKTYQELDKIQDKLTSMQSTKGFLDNSLVEKTNSLLSETRSKLDADGIESDFKEISNSVDILNNNLKELNTGNTLGKQEANFNVSLQNMENKIKSFVDRCKEMGNAEHLIERVEHAFRSINTDNIERASVDLRQMANTLNQAEREARQLSSTMNNTRTFFGNFGQEFRDNLFTFTAGELLADGIRNVAHSLKDLVMEYDKSITNLKKVANPEDIMDVSQLEAIEKKAVSIAKNVGQSSQDTIQAIADTIQMSGLSMEASTMVAEQTMMLANVAEMTQEAASKGVVTMLSAFKLDPLKEVPLVVDGATKSVNQMVDAMDKINYVGNKFAISSDGILDAITSGANVLATYGVSMNDTIAMITAANTTLQDTSRVGNGLKTISVKLAGIKTSAKDGRSYKLPISINWYRKLIELLINPKAVLTTT